MSNRPESKHTPGPWEVNKPAPALDGSIAIQIEGVTSMIAEVYEGQDERSQADARLIAAAPEMLKLIEDSYLSIGGNWRKRRDELLARILSSDSKY